MKCNNVYFNFSTCIQSFTKHMKKLQIRSTNLKDVEIDLPNSIEVLELENTNLSVKSFEIVLKSLPLELEKLSIEDADLGGFPRELPDKFQKMSLKYVSMCSGAWRHFIETVSQNDSKPEYLISCCFVKNSVAAEEISLLMRQSYQFNILMDTGRRMSGQIL